MSSVHILHEAPKWYAPLDAALTARGVPHNEIFLDGGKIDLMSAPPPGIYFNRLSASAHNRGRPHAVAYTRALLDWLDAHGRRVINGRNALEIAMSKSSLISALHAADISVPHSTTVVGLGALRDAARQFDGPFLIKPNRGGKGTGIARFDGADELERFLNSEDFGASIDSVYVLQDFIEPAQPYITRAEYVGRELVYALRSDTRSGFNLCPADSCAIPTPRATDTPRFYIEQPYHHPVIDQHIAFMAANDIEVAAIEFLIDRAGRPFTYDLNINTNYNVEAEAAAGLSGMAHLAEFLERTLAEAPATSSKVEIQASA
jgi:hypothetical protein